MLLTNIKATLKRSIAAGVRAQSTLSVHEAATDCRQLALPLAFMAWNEAEAKAFQPWVRKFSRQGYTSLVISLDPQSAKDHILKEGKTPTSTAILAYLESETTSLLSSSAAASFPPLLFAAHLATLPAQTYVSSHPLSGLLLHSPLQPARAAELHRDAFPTPLDDFTFEPNFPLAVMHEAGGKALGEERLVREFDEEDVQRLKGGLDEKGWKKVMEWMDQVGM